MKRSEIGAKRSDVKRRINHIIYQPQFINDFRFLLRYSKLTLNIHEEIFLWITRVKRMLFNISHLKNLAL